MKPRGRRTTAIWLAALTTACFEYDLTPPWVIGGPNVLGARVNVIAPGPWSAQLPAVWSGETRANPLPGERIRLDAFVATLPERVPDEPKFFACAPSADCVVAQWRNLPDCSDVAWPLLPDEPPCAITRFDGNPELVLPGFRSLEQAELDALGLRGLLSFDVRVIAGTKDLIATDECIDRYVSRDASLFDCALARFSVAYQQGAALVDALAPVGVSLGIDTAAVPFEWLWQEPNVHPVLIGLPFTVDDVSAGDLFDGAVADIPVGAEIRLGTPRTSRAQSFATLGTDYFSEWEEIPELGVWLDTDVRLLADSDEERPTAWVMPDVERMRVFITLDDGRGGVTWATFELRALSSE